MMEYTPEEIDSLSDTFVGFYGIATPFVLSRVVPVAAKEKLEPREVVLLAQALDAAGVVPGTAVGISSLVALMEVLGSAKNVQREFEGTALGMSLTGE